MLSTAVRASGIDTSRSDYPSGSNPAQYFAESLNHVTRSSLKCAYYFPVAIFGQVVRLVIVWYFRFCLTCRHQLGMPKTQKAHYVLTKESRQASLAPSLPGTGLLWIVFILELFLFLFCEFLIWWHKEHMSYTALSTRAMRESERLFLGIVPPLNLHKLPQQQDTPEVGY